MERIIKISLFITMLAVISVKAQQAPTKYPFLENVKAKIEDSSSAFFYEKLLNKIQTQPNAISQQDIFYLYYGQVTLNKPHGMPFFTDGMDDFIRAMIKQKYKIIAKFGLKMLKDSPVDLTILMNTALAVKKTNQPDSLSLDKRVRMLFDVILSTGDGRSKETAIKIADVQDSAIIKDVLKFNSGKEQIEQGDGVPLSAWINGDQKLYIENVWAYFNNH